MSISPTVMAARECTDNALAKLQAKIVSKAGFHSWDLLSSHFTNLQNDLYAERKANLVRPRNRRVVLPGESETTQQAVSLTGKAQRPVFGMTDSEFENVVSELGKSVPSQWAIDALNAEYKKAVGLAPDLFA